MWIGNVRNYEVHVPAVAISHYVLRTHCSVQAFSTAWSNAFRTFLCEVEKLERRTRTQMNSEHANDFHFHTKAHWKWVAICGTNKLFGYHYNGGSRPLPSTCKCVKCFCVGRSVASQIEFNWKKFAESRPAPEAPNFPRWTKKKNGTKLCIARDTMAWVQWLRAPTPAQATDCMVFGWAFDWIAHCNSLRFGILITLKFPLCSNKYNSLEPFFSLSKTFPTKLPTMRRFRQTLIFFVLRFSSVAVGKCIPWRSCRQFPRQMPFIRFASQLFRVFILFCWMNGCLKAFTRPSLLSTKDNRLCVIF